MYYPIGPEEYNHTNTICVKRYKYSLYVILYRSCVLLVAEVCDRVPSSWNGNLLSVPRKVGSLVIDLLKKRQTIHPPISRN